MDVSLSRKYIAWMKKQFKMTSYVLFVYSDDIWYRPIGVHDEYYLKNSSRLCALKLIFTLYMCCMAITEIKSKLKQNKNFYFKKFPNFYCFIFFNDFESKIYRPIGSAKIQTINVLTISNQLMD